METTSIMIIGGVVLLVGFMIYTHRAAKSMEGTSAEILLEIMPEIADHDPALVYCFTTACGPCKSMLPVIEGMQADDRPVFKLDVRAHLSLSRRCGIRATPTTLVVRDGMISKVVIGMKTRPALDALLES